jgi:hypothetical protein
VIDFARPRMVPVHAPQRWRRSHIASPVTMFVVDIQNSTVVGPAQARRSPGVQGSPSREIMRPHRSARGSPRSLAGRLRHDASRHLHLDLRRTACSRCSTMRARTAHSQASWRTFRIRVDTSHSSRRMHENRLDRGGTNRTGNRGRGRPHRSTAGPELDRTVRTADPGRANAAGR